MASNWSCPVIWAASAMRPVTSAKMSAPSSVNCMSTLGFRNSSKELCAPFNIEPSSRGEVVTTNHWSALLPDALDHSITLVPSGRFPSESAPAAVRASAWLE